MTPGYGRLEIVPPPAQAIIGGQPKARAARADGSAPTPAPIFASNNPNTIASGLFDALCLPWCGRTPGPPRARLGLTDDRLGECQCSQVSFQ